MAGIEERIEITGADESKRRLDEVARAQEGVARSVDDTGTSSTQAATSAEKLGRSALDMVGKFAGVAAILSMFKDLVALLEEAVALQHELAQGAATFGGESKAVARQLGLNEALGASILTRLRLAGGLDAATASQLAIGSDIALGKAGLGGLLAGENLGTIESLAAFAGAKGFAGSEAADLVKLLALTGSLGSAGAAQDAVAKIAAAATKSDATTVGAFVAQTLRGGTGLLQQGVPLADVLTLGAQARSVEVNEELAAQSLITLEQVAVAGAEPKFTAEIARIAALRGLDPGTLTSAQRVQLSRDILGGITTQAEQDRIQGLLSPERFLRLSKAFRGSSVEASAPVTAAIAGAGVPDFAAAIAQGAGELSFREAQNLAAAEFESYQAGAERYTLAAARARAKALVDRDIARGIARGLGREAEEERYVLELLRVARDQLAASGADVSDIDVALGDVGTLIPRIPLAEHLPLVGDLLSGTGFRDTRLSAVASAIDNARRRTAQAPASVTIIGTQYVDRDPLIDPPPAVDRGN